MIVLLIATILLLVPIWYPILLWVLGLVISKGVKKGNIYPKVTLIVPTYNEETFVQDKIKNILELDYPRKKMQVIFVDSASTDNTVAEIKKFKFIKLRQQKERLGKASAINYALRHARGKIVITTDANAFLSRNSIRELVKYFVDPSVGAVTAKSYAKSGTNVFFNYENLLKKLESKLDSAVAITGRLSAFRRDLVKSLDEHALCEDLDLSIVIREKGFRLAYAENAEVWKASPRYFREEYIQRERWTIGTWQAVVKHKAMLFNPKYGFYGILIFPMHKLMPLLEPFSLLLFLVVLAYVSLPLSLAVIAAGLFAALIFKSILLLLLTLVAAPFDFILGRYSVKWKKVEQLKPIEEK